MALRCHVDVHALLSVNPQCTAAMDRRRVMHRRLKQGTPLRLPTAGFAQELFHFEWVMCDTCDKWRHLRLSPPEFWDVQLRSTWSCGTRVGFDEYGASRPTTVHPEACAVPQVTWKTPAPAAAAPLPALGLGGAASSTAPLPPLPTALGAQAAPLGGGRLRAERTSSAGGSSDTEGGLAPAEGEAAGWKWPPPCLTAPPHLPPWTV